jgi:hypothetical protein
VPLFTWSVVQGLRGLASAEARPNTRELIDAHRAHRELAAERHLRVPRRAPFLDHPA